MGFNKLTFDYISIFNQFDFSVVKLMVNIFFSLLICSNMFEIFLFDLRNLYGNK